MPNLAHHRAGLVPLAVLAMLPACASAYQLPPETVALRSTLDDDRARAIVADLLKKDPSHPSGAFLGSNAAGTQVLVRDTRVVDKTVEYVAPGPNKAPAAPADPGCDLSDDVRPTTQVFSAAGGTYVQEKAVRNQICTYHVALDNLWRVRVNETDADTRDGVAHRTIAGYLVWIQESKTRYLVLNIREAQLNPLIAALTYFSPTTEVLHGAGF